MALESRAVRGAELRLAEPAVVLWLAAWTFLLRFPFFFPATINWDESTFIIMGQGILDGLLPYQTLWDLKPPLAFAFFAGAIALFGKSIAAVRVAGFLWVLLFAWVIYRCGIATSRDRIAAVAAATAGVTAASVLSPAVMTEIVCLVPLSAALLVSLRSEGSSRSAFAVGVLLAISAMVRTNLALVVVSVGMEMLLTRPKRDRRTVLAGIAAFVFGGALVVAVTALPFILQGELRLWFDSVFLAPLSFLGSQHPMRLLPGLLAGTDGIGTGPVIPYALLALAALVWLAVLWGLWTSLRFVPAAWSEPRQARILATYLAGSIAAAVFAGPPQPHYLVQLVPVAVVLAAVALAALPTAGSKRVAQAALTAVLIAVSVDATRESYEILVERFAAGETLRHGDGYEVAAYLERANPERLPIWMLSDHIVYWLVGQYPPTRMATHPSNVARSELIRAVEGPSAGCDKEIDKIFARTPEFVVTHESEWYFALCPGGGKRIAAALARDYRLDTKVAGLYVLRRNPAPR